MRGIFEFQLLLPIFPFLLLLPIFHISVVGILRRPYTFGSRCPKPGLNPGLDGQWISSRALIHSATWTADGPAVLGSPVSKNRGDGGAPCGGNKKLIYKTGSRVRDVTGTRLGKMTYQSDVTALGMEVFDFIECVDYNLKDY